MVTLSRRKFMVTTGVGVLGAAAATMVGMPKPVRAEDLSVDEARKIVSDAYIYGYSLMTSYVTRVQMSNVPKVEELHAPLNQFFNIKKYPPATYRGVSGTNADTLYSCAWLDLTEPQILSKPDTGDRFYVFEMVDLWMNVFAAPDLGTEGGAAANYLLTGPGWKGEVPSGMKHIPVDTFQMVIIGRTYADGSEESYKIVNALQAQYKITPLSAWGKAFDYKTPPVTNPGFSMTAKPIEVIKGFGIEDYFNRMAKLMAHEAPPAPEDAPMLARMATVGIAPGQLFDIKKLAPAVQAAVKDIPTTALETMHKQFKDMGVLVNGWKVAAQPGDWSGFGTNYLQRGAIAAFGWPGEKRTVSTYPLAFVDSKGRKLDGANNYTMTFPKGGMPPVKAFWSITMYVDDNGYWFYPNAINRLTISPRDNPKPNADGSTTLYFQHESPGADKESNWLPAPDGPFVLCLRMYWPSTTPPSILDGTWQPPGLQLTK